VLRTQLCEPSISVDYDGQRGRSHTSNSWFFILLEIIVYEPENEGRLYRISMLLRLRPMYHITFPTAASPSRTSFTLLLGFGAAGVVSVILCHTFKCPAQK